MRVSAVGIRSIRLQENFPIFNKIRWRSSNFDKKRKWLNIFIHSFFSFSDDSPSLFIEKNVFYIDFTFVLSLNNF